MQRASVGQKFFYCAFRKVIVAPELQRLSQQKAGLHVALLFSRLHLPDSDAGSVRKPCMCSYFFVMCTANMAPWICAGGL
jgi:hypothetical protein